MNRHPYKFFGLFSMLLLAPALAQDSNANDPNSPIPAAISAKGLGETGKLESTDTIPATADSTSVSVKQSVDAEIASERETVSETRTIDQADAEKASSLDRKLDSSSPNAPMAEKDATPSTVQAEPESGAAESAAKGNEDANYLKALSKEAGAVETRTPPTGISTRSGAARVSRIRSIVSEALEAPAEPDLKIRLQDEKNVGQQTRQRRLQKLRKAVSSASEATDMVGDKYISTLQREGSRTVVIDEATSKRSAIAPRTPLPSALKALVAVPTKSERTYQVKPGDSLWRIAQRFYGDGHRYPVLFEANKDQIIAENILVVGQVLRIP